MPTLSARRPRSIYFDRYEVDRELDRLQLTYKLLADAAWQGDLDRRSAPPFGYEGQSEFDAGSRTRSAICEHGGETEGGWHAGRHFKIPVAFNHNELIAIHATAGIVGTGRAEADPTNHSLKGPWSKLASEESAQTRLDIEDTDNTPVDFWWYLTRPDEEGLWAEMFAPLFNDETGYATDFATRIILGNLSDGPATRRRSVPDVPSAPNIDISRRLA